MTFAQLNYGSAFAELGQTRQQAALRDFQAARQQAALQEVLARLTGKSSQLLSYDEVAEKLHLRERVERGIQEIPVEAIVGSVGRYSDFTRTFLPRHDHDKGRWARVDTALAHEGRAALPPIDVYKVGEAYFVLDGNHRVSVARQLGLTHLDAHVIEMPTRIPLTPGVSPDDLIIKAEYADFLEQTGLNVFCCLFDLSLTVPGQYQKLKDHIEIVRTRLSEAHGQDVSYPEAAQAWYDSVYLPTVLAIRERGLLRWHPGRTETDLYMWIAEHRQTLEDELGWAVRPEAAITDLAARSRLPAARAAPGNWRKDKLAERYTAQLFKDILVPLQDSPEGWAALEQALLIARREAAQLYGLHVITAGAETRTEEILPLRVEFRQRCEAAGVEGSLVVEAGEVSRKILERALLTDLVVLSLTHPPVEGLPSLSSGLRTIIWKSARPILTVPGTATPMRRALLAYDGSPKANEALFVATYVAEQWQMALSVVTLTDNAKVQPSVVTYAREYLDWHEIEAEFIVTPGHVDTFVKIASERGLDLMLLGGYSVSPLAEVMGGSAVNYLLRDARCPLFICQ